MPDTPTTRRINELQEFVSIQPGEFVPIDSNARGTGKYDIGSLVAASQGAGPVWDDEAECYTNQSLARMLSLRRDGLAYGVSIPKGSTVACTKTAANAAIATPTPGWVGHPAVDPYVGLGPFWHVDVNGHVDEDGMPHVTAIEGDGRFRRDGTRGDVWVMAPVLYWNMDESGQDSVELSISDTPLTGMSAQPQAYLPDGTLRPYMLYAKYVGVEGADGKMHSYSGRKPWNRTVSHDSLITQCANATTGYSAKSIADDWYVKVMFLVKYGTKNSQSVFYGCANYTAQCAPTVAETGVKRVIVSNANAANFHVGSACMFGTHTGNNDRNTASNFNILDGLRIESITDYDANNKAINFETDATFDTATSYYLSTSPWFSGSLDAVEGDGSITQAGLSNGHEPLKLQGIELMMGVLEIVGDVMLDGNSTLGWEMCVNHDSRNEATSKTSDYVSSGKYIEAGSSAGHHYPLYPSSASGMIVGQGTGGSQTVGMCDSQYTAAKGTGTKEWYGGGHLTFTGNAGLFYAHGSNALTGAIWAFGSRLSATGRSRAAA